MLSGLARFLTTLGQSCTGAPNTLYCPSWLWGWFSSLALRTSSQGRVAQEPPSSHGALCDSNTQAGISKGLLGTHILGHWTLLLSSQVPEDSSHSLQTLESSVLGPGQEKGLRVHDPAQASQPAGLPVRIREIVTSNFSQPESPGATPSVDTAHAPLFTPLSLFWIVLSVF
jgi:hypothetical protein